MSQMSQFVSGCRGVVITGQRNPVTTKRETMAFSGANYGSFQLKVPQTLIAGTSNAGSVYGVQCFLTFGPAPVKGFLRSTALIIWPFHKKFVSLPNEIRLSRKWHL